MRKKIHNIIVACAITFSFASCVEYRCPAFPPEVASYLEEQEDSICFTNSIDSVCFSVDAYSSGAWNISWNCKCICEINSNNNYYNNSADMNLNIGCFCDGGGYVGYGSDNPENWDFSTIRLCWYVNGSYHGINGSREFEDTLSFTPSWEMVECPWGDTIRIFDVGPYDSVCFVKNQGMVSFYNRQDSTTWRRVMP